jgi:hypothetical protein
MDRHSQTNRQVAGRFRARGGCLPPLIPKMMDLSISKTSGGHQRPGRLMKTGHLLRSLQSAIHRSKTYTPFVSTAGFVISAQLWPASLPVVP